MEKLYAEGCSFVRHYSNCSLNVRLAALVQGLILISACDYVLVTLRSPIFLVLTSLFGLLLTGLLWFMHRGYLQAANAYATETEKIELHLSSGIGGPVVCYERVRVERYKSCWYRVITIHATFTVVAVPFIGFLIVGIVYALR